MTRLSPHFTLDEATKSQTAIRLGLKNDPTPDEIERMKVVAMEILEPIRVHYGTPFIPSSFFRGSALNTAIGSKETSQHRKGEAVDIEIPGVSNWALACWIRENLDFDQLILENYTPGKPSSGWVHVSCKASGNRRQVLTYTGGKYLTGLAA